MSVTNNNQVDNSVDNSTNDNRVDNRVTYNVRTKDGKPAREYACEKTGAKKTNVNNVSWHKAAGKWLVRYVDPVTKKLAHVGYCKEFDDACAAREEAQAREGTREGAKRPGVLKYNKKGRPFCECGRCGKKRKLAAFAPDPKMKAKFDRFRKACDDLGSGDKERVERAEEILGRMPIGMKNDALRTSVCRGCRDTDRKSKQEGPNSRVAKCRAA